MIEELIGFAFALREAHEILGQLNIKGHQAGSLADAMGKISVVHNSLQGHISNLRKAAASPVPATDQSSEPPANKG